MDNITNYIFNFMLENHNNDKIMLMSNEEIMDYIVETREDFRNILSNTNLTEAEDNSDLNQKDLKNIDKLVNLNKKLIDAIDNKLEKVHVYTEKVEELEVYSDKLKELNNALEDKNINPRSLFMILVKNIYVFMRMYPVVSNIIYNAVGLSAAIIGTSIIINKFPFIMATFHVVGRVVILLTLWYIIFEFGDYLLDKINMLASNKRNELTKEEAKKYVKEGMNLYNEAKKKLEKLRTV